MNLRSLNANFDKLNELLTNYDISPDIIAMSETKLKLSQVYNAKLSKKFFFCVIDGEFIIIIITIIFIYLPSDVISQEKTATSSRSITKASKYAIPLKPTHKLAESKRYLVTW